MAGLIDATPGKAAELTAYLESIGALPADHPRSPTGKPSTTSAVFEKLDHLAAHAYVRIKQIDKIGNDYPQKRYELAINGAGAASTRQDDER